MTVNLLDEPLVKGLLDETIPFYELLNTYSIQTYVVFNLRGNVNGFVYVSQKGKYHILLNGNLSYKEQCYTFAHEIKHIVQDLPYMSYYVGFDMQHEELEDDTEIVGLLLSC